jgi:hypothetical protein
MSLLRPVSAETLSSIPWMSAKSLSHAMREVSLRGPNDKDTWIQLLSRADVISHSLNNKQNALLLNSIARIRRKEELTGIFDTFLRRHASKFLVHLIPESSPLDLAHVLHALGEFSDVLNPPNEVLQAFRARARESISAMDEKSLGIACFGLYRLRLGESSVVGAVLSSAQGRLEFLSDRTLVQVINLATICPDLGSKLRGSLLELSVEAIKRMPHMDHKTVFLLIKSIAKLRISTPDLTAAILEWVNGPGFAQVATVEQLKILMKSLEKLKLDTSDISVLHRVEEILHLR